MMDPSTVTHTVDVLAKTQMGIFALALVAAIIGILWALTTFGILKPKNGSSIHAVTAELRRLNETAERFRSEWGPKVERTDDNVRILLDRTERR